MGIVRLAKTLAEERSHVEGISAPAAATSVDAILAQVGRLYAWFVIKTIVSGSVFPVF